MGLPQVEAAGQAVDRPAEQTDRLRAREAVGHAIDVRDRVEAGVTGLGRLGEHSGV